MELRFENITKKYKDKVALKDFTVTLNEGIYGLLGANGSGKTTLMRIVVDVLEPSSGKVLLDGEDKNILDEKYRDVIGYLPQDIGFYNNFSVETYLKYIGTLKGLNKDVLIERIKEILECVNLSDVRKKKIGKLSGGMKRRVGIAQALLNDPKILILDEPTAGLDPKERIKFRNLLSNISDGKIIIISTHIVSDIEFIAKEVMIIKDGNLIEKNTIDNLTDGIKDKLWTVDAIQCDLSYYEENFNVASIVRMDNNFTMKIISDRKPIEKAKRCNATLEDVYLYYFERNEDEEGGGYSYDFEI